MVLCAVGWALLFASGCHGEGPPPECSGVGPLDSSDTGIVVAGPRAAPPPLVPLEREAGLPVFRLFRSGSLPDEEGYQTGWLVQAGRCHPIELRIRGNASREYPKRSYTLKFAPGTLAQGTPGVAADIRHKLVLASNFNDNSHLRQRLAFALWNLMSPEHVQVNAYNAIVYMDGEYAGLYTAIDHVDDELLAVQGLGSGGELFKAVRGTANFSRLGVFGEPKDPLHTGFERKGTGALEVDGDDAYASIDALTRFVADSAPEAFSAQVGQRFELDAYVDWWVLQMLLRATDNATKNAYHLLPVGAVRRWRYIPWDYDGCLGQNFHSFRTGPEDLPDYDAENLLFARMLADPVIAARMRERLKALVEGELDVDTVLALIDGYAAEIAPAARRDEERWDDAHRAFFRWNVRNDFNTHEEEVEYLREWVRARWQFLRDNGRSPALPRGGE